MSDTLGTLIVDLSFEETSFDFGFSEALPLVFMVATETSELPVEEEDSASFFTSLFFLRHYL